MTESQIQGQSQELGSSLCRRAMTRDAPSEGRGLIARTAPPLSGSCLKVNFKVKGLCPWQCPRGLALNALRLPWTVLPQALALRLLWSVLPQALGLDVALVRAAAGGGEVS